MPTLWVSDPVLAPTTTIGRPICVCGEVLDLVLAHVLDVEALPLQRRRSRPLPCSAPYMTKYV